MKHHSAGPSESLCSNTGQQSRTGSDMAWAASAVKILYKFSPKSLGRKVASMRRKSGLADKR